VRARQLWGNDIYTQDSDLVAVLMHCGFYNHALSAPPPSALEVRAVVQPLPPQPYYNSCARNSIRSRAWGAAVGGCSYRVTAQSRLVPLRRPETSGWPVALVGGCLLVVINCCHVYGMHFFWEEETFRALVKIDMIALIGCACRLKGAFWYRGVGRTQSLSPARMGPPAWCPPSRQPNTSGP
jgi:hypothetical protein